MADVRARLHPKLLQFVSEVKRGFLEKTYTVQGMAFTLRTPNDDAESWADGYVKQTNVFSFVSSRRAPRLACAIVSMDGVPTSDLFQKPDDMGADDWKQLNASPDKKYWIWSQLLLVLISDIPSPVLVELDKKYEELIKERDEAINKVLDTGPNSSTGTPGSESVATS